MKLSVGFSKAELIEMINQDLKINDSKKELLKFILNIDSNFVIFSFGLGDETSVDWDYMYNELKTYFIPALLNSQWDFSFAETRFEEEILIVRITFEQNETINDFLFRGTFKKDNRIYFNQMEIYLDRNDMKKALEQDLIKEREFKKWLQDSLS